MADGTKLPPYVIFKRKTLPKGMEFPRGVCIRVHPKGWMDEHLMIDWLKTVWGRRPGGLLRNRSLLVLDAFRCHRMPVVKNILEKDKTDLAIIPGGMTSILQPLDVCVNKPFKHALKRKWNAWLVDDKHTYTAGGRMRAPTLAEIAQWIDEIWRNLDPQLIVKGFLKCCISNAMDGSKDDFVWNDVDEATASEDDDSDSDDNDDDLFYENTDDIAEGAIAELFNDDDDVEEFNFEGF